MIHFRNRSGSRSPLFALLFLPLCAGAQKVPVGDELERLSATYGFKVVGLEATEDAMGRADGDVLYPRLRRLLDGFDHVIVQSPGGGIDRVIVLGAKVPFVPTPRTPAGAPDEDGSGDDSTSGDIVLKTERRGTQHSVEVSLEGPGGKRTSRSLLIDTGADFVVLPSSLARGLGISPSKLEQDEMQTANGQVEARVSVLPALWLGDHRVPDVRVAFIDESKLGSTGLLGMSVLGRYTMTIDDEDGTLTLASKGAPGKGSEISDAESDQPEAEEGAVTRGDQKAEASAK